MFSVTNPGIKCPKFASSNSYAGLAKIPQLSLIAGISVYLFDRMLSSGSQYSSIGSSWCSETDPLCSGL